MAYSGKYNSPSDLMGDESLKKDEKIAMLEDWRDDKNALLRASGEGMDGEMPAEVLSKVKKYLSFLKDGTAD